MTAEWHRKPGIYTAHYICQPQIDLLPLTPEALQSVVCALDKLHEKGSVFIHCTLGLSRSAMVVAAWLLKQHPEYDIPTVITMLHQARPHVTFRQTHLNVLVQWAEYYQHRRV